MKRGDFRDCKAFIEDGGNIYELDENGRSALDIAVENSRLDLAALIIENGGSFHHSMNDGNILDTPLIEEDIDLIEGLCALGAPVNGRFGLTQPIFWAK